MGVRNASLAFSHTAAHELFLSFSTAVLSGVSIVYVWLQI